MSEVFLESKSGAARRGWSGDGGDGVGWLKMVT